MPEYPDITVYVEALGARVLDRAFESLDLRSPFLLRTVSPAPEALMGQTVREIRRVGKRIAFGFEGGWMVLHLMIAGRLHWRDKGKKPFGRQSLAVFRFASGDLSLTEAGSRRQASLHLVDRVEDLDPGGWEVFGIDADQFRERLTAKKHTLKRALTDPRLFSGIGNAYSDEILHDARLSPVALTQKLDGAQVGRLFESVQRVLRMWEERLRNDAGGEFPEGVTAFRPEMAVHGKFGQPCPVCGTKVQRIRYASNETNYCPRCQTEGRVLADRSLSRLLGSDWPRTVEEWEGAGRGRVSGAGFSP